MANRRPEIDDYTRIKRRKMSDSSDEGGGVAINLSDFGSPEFLKKEPKEREVKHEQIDPKNHAYTGPTKAKAEENGFKAAQTFKSEPTDAKYNPYLAHMEDQKDDIQGYGNGYGYGKTINRMNGSSTGTTIRHFPRHETTAAMAKKAEDGPNNAFTGKPLSKQYFNILKTRRNLPVHAQRSV